MRPLLDAIYAASAALAGIFLVGVLIMILAGIVTRAVGIYIPGTDAYAGYCMAASGFLALAPALRSRGHIRVELLVQLLSPARRAAWDRFCGLVGFAISGFLAWYSVRLAWQSHLFNDVSQGSDATPLWIPQIGMALGGIVLALAFLEICLATATAPDEVADDAGHPAVVD